MPRVIEPVDGVMLASGVTSWLLMASLIMEETHRLVKVGF